MERKAGRLQRGFWRARPWEMVNWVPLTWSGSLWGRAPRQMCQEQCSQASCLGPPWHPVMSMAQQRWLLPAGSSPITHPPGVLPSNHCSLAGKPQWGCGAGQRGAAPSAVLSRCQQMGYGSASPLTNKQDFYRLSNPTWGKPDCHSASFPSQGLASLGPVPIRRGVSRRPAIPGQEQG